MVRVGRTKVMVADDDTLVLRSMTLMLGEMLGYEVVTVESAAEILQTARRTRPDVLLQDVSMPGLEIDPHLRKVRADPELADLPVVLISGSFGRSSAVPEGVAAVVAKPFDGQTLRELIDGLPGRAA